MNTSKNRKAVIVGLFTIVGLAIFMVAVFALGAQHKIFVKTIQVKASFVDVNGLIAGDNVWFEGVYVGTVKSVSLSKNAKVEVLMNIEKKSLQYIHIDAKAKIGSDGLIGNRIVVIVGGTDESPIIRDGDIIAVEKALTLDELANTLQKNNLNLLDITGDLKKVTGKIASGKGTIGKLLEEDTLINNVQEVVSVLKQASLNARMLTLNLESYSSKLQTKGSFTNDLVNDTIIFHQLRATVSQIQEVSKKVGVIADNLQTASKNLNDSSKPVGLLLSDRQLADTLKVILGNLKDGSKKLDDDLEAAQHNFLLRGFFKKKSKQEAKNKN